MDKNDFILKYFKMLILQIAQKLFHLKKLSSIPINTSEIGHIICLDDMSLSKDEIHFLITRTPPYQNWANLISKMQKFYNFKMGFDQILIGRCTCDQKKWMLSLDRLISSRHIMCSISEVFIGIEDNFLSWKIFWAICKISILKYFKKKSFSSNPA